MCLFYRYNYFFEFLILLKGLGNNLSVSLLKQTPATNGCPPFLAVLSFPNGIRSGQLFPMELGTRKDMRVSKADFSKKSADWCFILLPTRKSLE
jgi:hypothetical protein